MKIKRFEEAIIRKLLNYIQDLEDLLEQYEEDYGTLHSNEFYKKKYGVILPLYDNPFALNGKLKWKGDDDNYDD